MVQRYSNKKKKPLTSLNSFICVFFFFNETLYVAQTEQMRRGSLKTTLSYMIYSFTSLKALKRHRACLDSLNNNNKKRVSISFSEQCFITNREQATQVFFAPVNDTFNKKKKKRLVGHIRIKVRKVYM